jgi:hypothetical protein
MTLLTQTEIDQKIQDAININKKRLNLSQAEIVGEIKLVLSGKWAINMSNSVVKGRCQVWIVDGQSDQDVLNFDASESTFNDELIIKSELKLDLNLTTSRLNKGIVASNSKIGFLNCNLLQYRGQLNFFQSEIDVCMFQSAKEIDDNSRIYFDWSKFHQRCELQDSSLINPSFILCEFGGVVNMTKTKFKNASNAEVFVYCKFKDKLYLRPESVVGPMTFIGAVFNDDVFVTHITSDQNEANHSFDFSECIFEKQLRIYKISFLELNLENAIINGFVKLQDVYVKRVSFKGVIFTRTEFENFTYDPDDVNLQTLLILVREYSKSGNSFEATKQTAKLLSVYEESLNWKESSEDKLALRLNKLSNRFGASWIQGVAFTFFFSFVLYFLYVLSLKCYDFSCGTYFKNYFEFFVLTHRLDFMENNGPSGLSYFIDSLTRVVVGYGIVQTVQAFRKHSKTS